jgi:small subunit ribosomal protein S18
MSDMKDQQDSRPMRQDSDGGEARRDDDRGSGGPRRGKGFFKKKVCKFCAQKLTINYKDADVLRRFVTDRGKILPRRITGSCAKHQRELAVAIKRGRALAFLPYVVK